MREFRTPDGSLHRFPDDFTDDQVNQALIRWTEETGRERVTQGTDILRSIASGGIRGAIGVAGMPMDLANVANRAGAALDNWMMDNLPPNVAEQLGARRWEQEQIPQFAGGSADIMDLYNRSGLRPLHQPQTTAGDYASTAAEWGVGGLVGATSRARALGTALGVGGGTAAEAAKQAGGNQWAQLGAGVAAMAAPGAALSRLPNAGRMLREATEGMTPAEWDQAALREKMGQEVGIPLMGPQSVGPKGPVGDPLQSLAADVRANRFSGRTINRALERQRQQVEGATRAQVGQLKPQLGRPTPTEAGQAMQEGASLAIRERRKQRTRAASPFYQAAENQQISLPGRKQIVASIDNALPKVAGSPLEGTLTRLRDAMKKSYRVGPVYNVVKQERARVYPNNQLQQAISGVDATAQGIVGPVLDDVTRVLEAESQAFSRGQQTYQAMTPPVQELTRGRVGQIERTADPETIANILLDPKRTRPADIDLAASVIIPKRPGAFRDIARTAIENTLEAELGKAGGGARFARDVAGDVLKHENFRAFVKGGARDAGLNPDEVAKGWDKMLEVLERTDKIPGTGSPTATRLDTDKAAGQTMLSEGVNVPRRLGGFWSDLMRRRAYRTLADAMTAPDSLAQMQRLARLRVASPGAIATVQSILQGARAVGATEKKGPARPNLSGATTPGIPSVLKDWEVATGLDTFIRPATVAEKRFGVDRVMVEGTEAGKYFVTVLYPDGRTMEAGEFTKAELDKILTGGALVEALKQMPGGAAASAPR